jgi:hypothetical protein
MFDISGACYKIFQVKDLSKKVKLTLHAMKEYTGSGSVASLILNLGVRWYFQPLCTLGERSPIAH